MTGLKFHFHIFVPTGVCSTKFNNYQWWFMWAPISRCGPVVKERAVTELSFYSPLSFKKNVIKVCTACYVIHSSNSCVLLNTRKPQNQIAKRRKY